MPAKAWPDHWASGGRGAGMGQCRGWMAHAPGPMSLCCFGSLQNGLGFWVEREIKDHLVPTSFHRQRHLSPFTRPTRCCWVCVGHEGCGQVPVPPHCCPWHGGGGVLPRLQPAPAPRRTCRRQRRSVRNGGKVEGTQGSKEKPDFSSPICPPRGEQANFMALSA